jgi:hypothetical protein
VRSIINSVKNSILVIFQKQINKQSRNSISFAYDNSPLSFIKYPKAQFSQKVIQFSTKDFRIITLFAILDNDNSLLYTKSVINPNNLKKFIFSF